MIFRKMLKTNSKFSVLFGGPSKTLDRHDFVVDFSMMAQTFIADYLNYFGLWSGKEMRWGSLYPDEVKKHFNKKKKRFYSIDPESTVKGQGFVQKFASDCIFMISDNCFVFDVTRMEKLFRSYFHKLTGIKNYMWIRHTTNMESGIIEMMNIFIKDKPAKIGRKVFFPSMNDICEINFALDESLEEKHFFSLEFADIYEKLAEKEGVPVLFFCGKEELDLLEKRLGSIKTEYPEKSLMASWIQTVIDMIPTAKLKEVSLALRIIV